MTGWITKHFPPLSCRLSASRFEPWRINSREKADLLAFTPRHKLAGPGFNYRGKQVAGTVLMRVSGAERGWRVGWRHLSKGLAPRQELNISTVKRWSGERKCEKSSSNGNAEYAVERNVHRICCDDFGPAPLFSFPCQYPAAMGFSSARFRLLFVCQVGGLCFLLSISRERVNRTFINFSPRAHMRPGLRFSNIQCEGLNEAAV